jgi:hypothetical protein
VATCRWKDGLEWVAGNPSASGPCCALVSVCGERVTVTLGDNRQDAEKRQDFIDRLACGGCCLGWPGHRIYAMGGGV